MVNSLYSTRTLMPTDYHHLPFCQPEMGGPQQVDMNIGEILAGDRIYDSPYLLKMKNDMYCEQLCMTHVGRSEDVVTTPNRLVQSIRTAYHHNWIVDNLPAASKWEDEAIVVTRYWQGFPVGFINMVDMKSYVHNHVNIEIMYHENEHEPGTYRVVRFIVEPFSIHHEATWQTEVPPDNERFFRSRHYSIENPIGSCNLHAEMRHHTNYDMVNMPGQRPQEASGGVLFTYDVIWKENQDTQWASRWQIYLSMDGAVPAQVHWFFITNSLFVALTLSGLVAIILVRNVHRSMVEEEDGENAEAETRESLEDKGYALVHVDYFNPPDRDPFLLALCCGTGAQLFAFLLAIIVAALTGLLHSSKRGSFVIGALYGFNLCGVFNGFVTVQTAKLFKCQQYWSKSALAATLVFPSITFVLFLCQDFIALSQRSTLAVPAKTIVYLIVLWIGISAPATYLGAYIGEYKCFARLPTTPRTVLLGIASYRSIRNGDRTTKCLCLVFALAFNVGWLIIGMLWLLRSCLVKMKLWRAELNGVFAMLLGGAVCFGSMFVEVFYIMSSLWLGYYFFAFGFLLIIAGIFMLICGAVSILSAYSLLTVEASYSWWLQFLCSGATGMWLAFYSLFYAAEIEFASFPSILLFYGFMGWASLVIFLTSGFVGSLSSFIFIQALFWIGKPGATMLEHDADGIEIPVTEGPTETVETLVDCDQPRMVAKTELT